MNDSEDEGGDAPGSFSIGGKPIEEAKPMSELIERAKADARAKRAEAGLPPLTPDQLEQPRATKGKTKRR